VGTQNSHNIVSLSNDGKLCVWSTNNLTTPQKVIDLKTKAKLDKAEQQIVNSTTICFPEEEANNFYVGVEDGTVYSAQVHAKYYFKFSIKIVVKLQMTISWKAMLDIKLLLLD
jgi:dynein intermediate chain